MNPDDVNRDEVSGEEVDPAEVSPPRVPARRRVLPMFPLGTVLLPGAVLALHVFEPRYRALVHDCLAGDRELGVVLIERGHEVGGDDQRFDVGCRARVVEAVPFDDGRWALGIAGESRIRVERWLTDDPYPRAEVGEWPDPPAPPGLERRRDDVLGLLRRVLALAAETGRSAAPVTVEPDRDPAVAAYQIAAAAPLGPLDQLAVLSAPSTAARFDVLEEALDGWAAVLASDLGGG